MGSGSLAVPVSYIAHIASKDRCKPVARGPFPPRARADAAAAPHSMRTINIGPYLRSLIITWPSSEVRVGVRCVRLRARVTRRWYTRVLVLGYRTPRDTGVGHASP